MEKSRRRTERVACQIPARWNRAGGTVELTIGDASEQGVFINTREAAAPGALIQLEVVLPAASITMCLITRFVGATQSGSGIGAEIYLIGERERSLWSNYYKTLLKASRSAAREKATRAPVDAESAPAKAPTRASR